MVGIRFGSVIDDWIVEREDGGYVSEVDAKDPSVLGDVRNKERRLWFWMRILARYGGFVKDGLPCRRNLAVDPHRFTRSDEPKVFIKSSKSTNAMHTPMI